MDFNLQELKRFSKDLTLKENQNFDVFKKNEKKRSDENKYFFHQNSLVDNYHKSLNYFKGFSLKFEDLIMWTPKGFCITCENAPVKQIILKGITSTIKKGSMLALCGPTYEYKFLFKFLASRRYNKRVLTSCDFFINEINTDDIENISEFTGFVGKEDIIEENLTVFELFEYYAKMKGFKDPKKMGYEIIELMGLQGCANTIVGKDSFHGITKAEKKRTNIGVELISHPNLLFLQEPDFGFNFSTAVDILKIIRRLSNKGMTIICSLNKPNNNILKLFDKVIILTEGDILYDGPPNKIRERLNNLNIKCRNYTAASEHFLNCIDRNYWRTKFEIEKIDYLGDRDKLKTKFFFFLKKITDFQTDILIKRYETKIKTKKISEYDNKLKLKKLKNNAILNKRPNTFKNFYVYVKKNAKIYFFDQSSLVHIFYKIFVFILIFLAFIKMDNIEDDPLKAIQNKGGFLFLATISSILIGYYNVQVQFQKQVLLYIKKDRKQKIYSDFIFFIGSQTVTFLISFLLSTILTIIYYFSLNLNKNNLKNLFWMWIFLSLCTTLIGRTRAMIVVLFAGRKTKPEHLNLFNLFFIIPEVLMAGYFVQIRNVPWIFKWICFLSPIRYIFQGLILNEFSNFEKYKDNCPTDIKSGCNPFVFYNFHEKTIWLNLVLFFVIFFLDCIVIFLLSKFRFKKFKRSFSDDHQVILSYSKLKKYKK